VDIQRPRAKAPYPLPSPVQGTGATASLRMVMTRGIAFSKFPDEDVNKSPGRGFSRGKEPGPGILERVGSEGPQDI